jgi:branched-chain amino acid transport system ATP-binding protein
VLRGVSLNLSAGEWVALIGPNGCGKSTLFRVVAGLLQPEKGEIRLNGQLLTRRRETDERARIGVAYLPQTGNIFAKLSVAENLRLAGIPGGDQRAIAKRTQLVLGFFPEVAARLDVRAGLLSGGGRQMLAAAMALTRPTRLLLLDEPVAGLSQAAGSALLQAIQALQCWEGFAILIIEHRLRRIQPFIDRALVMREGKIVHSATDTKHILDAAWLAAHYLGESARS